MGKHSKLSIRLEPCITLVICALMAVRIPVVMYIAQGLFIIFALINIGHRRFRIGRSQREYFTYAILFFLFCTVSIAWAGSSQKWAASMRSIVQIYLISILLFLVVQTKDRFNYLSNSITIAGWVILAYIVIATPLSSWRDMLYGSYSLNSSRGRLGPSIGMHTNMCGSVLLVFLMFSIYKIIESKKKLYYLQAVLLLICLLFTKSRMSLIAALGGMFVFFVVYRRMSGKQVGRIIIVIFAVILLGYLSLRNQFLYSLYGKRIESLLFYVNSSGRTDASVIGRLALQRKAIEVFTSYPLFGVGIGNFSFFNDLSGSVGSIYAHNNYLELLADVGIVGTLFYYIPYIICEIRLVRCIRNSKETERMLYTTFFAIIGMRLLSDFGQVSYLYDFNQILLATAFAGIKVFRYSGKEDAGINEKAKVDL